MIEDARAEIVERDRKRMEEEEEVDTEKLTPSSVIAKMQASELINKEEQDPSAKPKLIEKVTLVREVKGDRVRE